jgi:tetratricopeptide (TPR) repeat protein
MSESVSHQALLEQLQACSSQDERERLLMRFTLERLPEYMRDAVQAAAVPRFFDQAFLNALLDQPLDEAQFAELTSLSYIEPYPGEGRFNVHERSRKLLQEKLWQEDEALYLEISRRALAHCVKQDQNDTTWRIETVYHQLIAEPEEGAAALNNTCVAWYNPPYFAYDKAESLLRSIREHVKTNRLPEKTAHYFWLNQARVDIRYARFHEAKEVLQNHILAEEDDFYLMVEKLKALGDAHRYLSEPSEAQLYYAKVLLLCRNIDDRSNEAECLLRLGEVHLRRSEYQEASQHYAAGLEQYGKIGDRLGEAECLKSLGHVRFHRAEYQEARLLYNEARMLYCEMGARMGEADCLRVLGDLHRHLSELPEARQHVEEALQLYRDIHARLGEANSIQHLGHIHYAFSEFHEARKRYEEALILYQEMKDKKGNANCLKSIGDIERETGNYPLAQQYYMQSSILFESIPRPDGIAKCLESFAKLHQAQQQFPQAEEYWQKAADMYRQLAMPLRAEHCLEQLRQMKEQENAAGKQSNPEVP